MGWVLLIPLLPALAFVVLAPLPRAWRTKARFVAVGAALGSLALSLAAFWAVFSSKAEESAVEKGGSLLPALYHAFAPLARIGETTIGAGLRLDAVSAVMLVVVTLVGACVQIYSLAYMAEEERIGWYYAVLSLFTAAMLLLVLSDNLLELYAAWEVMGLCSYLLIGFWHEHEESRKASMKAFLVTRVGDIGFALGLAVIFKAAGTFDLAAVLTSAPTWGPGVATAAALLLFFGAMGKSAQFPLHVWLPDAMAGPTPASALIHAATMVAAGVYLVARTLPIFAVSGVALTVVMVTGAVTALFGGLLAVVQYDVKKVLAYSTISQLGYMFIALGAVGAVPALFHLVAHAFFKSLMFLGAGVIIHACHTQDMREMGGLGKLMPWTAWAFTPGVLALAGVPPFSGFFSKDEILAGLLKEGHYVIFVIALVAAAVTAFYVARLWIRVFLGPPNKVKAHDGGWLMTLPMMVLAGVTGVLGFGSPAFQRLMLQEAEWPSWGMFAVSVVVASAGFGLGWLIYGRGAVDTGKVKERLGLTYVALQRKAYLDDAYGWFVALYHSVAHALASFDSKVVDGVVNVAAEAFQVWSEAGQWFDSKVVDGAVNGAAGAVTRAGTYARKVQTGRVQSYQRLLVAGLILLVLVVLWKGV